MNEKICIKPRQVVEHALSLKKEFTAIQFVASSGLRKLCSWKPFKTGFLKLNVDGDMFSDLHRAGVRDVLRDEKWDIVIAASKVENEVADSEDIELLATFRGLKLCAYMGI